MEQYIMLIVIVVVFGGMMWWQSKKAKQQSGKQDFRRNLARHRGHHHRPVMRQGRQSRRAVKCRHRLEGSSCISASMPSPVVHPPGLADDEVDENGNPLPDEDTEAPANDEAGQVRSRRPSSEEDTADETVTTTKPRRSKLFDSVAPSAYHRKGIKGRALWHSRTSPSTH